jgi:membrane peptidoglycan carboxypeptidase
MKEVGKSSREHYSSILKLSHDKKYLTEEQYQELSKEPLTTLDELEQAYSKMQYLIISNRIIKGAEVIERETDQSKRRQYLRVYEELERKLNDLKGA